MSLVESSIVCMKEEMLEPNLSSPFKATNVTVVVLLESKDVYPEATFPPYKAAS